MKNPARRPQARRGDSSARLLRTARENPWWQFPEDDLAAMMNLSVHSLSMMKRAQDTPFSNDLSRPERVAEWLAKHPGWKPSQER